MTRSIPKDAYTFLADFARKPENRRMPWPPCIVIDLAALHGIAFQEQRHWGGVFARAAKDGLIKRAGMFQRASSNNSFRPGWVGA